MPRLRVCSHRSGVPRLGVVTVNLTVNLAIQSLFFSWSRLHARWGTQPRRVTRSASPGRPVRLRLLDSLDSPGKPFCNYLNFFSFTRVNFKLTSLSKDFNFYVPQQKYIACYLCAWIVKTENNACDEYTKANSFVERECNEKNVF